MMNTTVITITSKTKTIQVNWDTEGEETDLPDFVAVPSDLEEEEVPNYLSDIYGWCVNGWCA